MKKDVPKEIGGYIEFEHYDRPMLHETAIALNCGRNCLAYLIRAKKVKKMWLPYFLCDSVKKICYKEKVEVRFYSIDEHFMPCSIEQQVDEWIYIVNYYGQITAEQFAKIRLHYHHIILDQAQAYFQSPPSGIDTLYTCRKFFGVSDGAFLYTDTFLDEPLLQDESFGRMRFLLGRFERNASEFYEDYSRNNSLFNSEPIKYMSRITKNLLKSIDYEQVKKRRTDNFNYLADRLGRYNLLKIHSVAGAFAYPLRINNGAEVRCKLQKMKIYIPCLWPNVLNEMNANSLEHCFADEILPLPCDQRYSIDDMNYIAQELIKCHK